ncbi:uncharacterized protein N7459_000338 [Penicillium hispanicum]|uniref:uncharacterized protein n=1 Tax=Penicillium hispanicum TaxID=1080232 RepID=UPI0025425373|nr:uncharacterized protein N7459_000338 [Penicillium hispanicum]KAJ5594130.1 hypothetical protein N7459_000338 [Penicillium hispanicum]
MHLTTYLALVLSSSTPILAGITGYVSPGKPNAAFSNSRCNGTKIDTSLSTKTANCTNFKSGPGAISTEYGPDETVWFYPEHDCKGFAWGSGEGLDRWQCWPGHESSGEDTLSFQVLINPEWESMRSTTTPAPSSTATPTPTAHRRHV